MDLSNKEHQLLSFITTESNQHGRFPNQFILSELDLGIEFTSLVEKRLIHQRKDFGWECTIKGIFALHQANSEWTPFCFWMYILKAVQSSHSNSLQTSTPY